MRITIDEVKESFYCYLNSEGRHWRSKLEACVESAFWGYNGQEEYLRLAWDEYGIESLVLVAIDNIAAENKEADKSLQEFLNAIQKLSVYLHDTYADYYDIPLLLPLAEAPPEPLAEANEAKKTVLDEVATELNVSEVETGEEKASAAIADLTKSDTPVDELPLSGRTITLLKMYGITTFGQLEQAYSCGALARKHRLGKFGFQEIVRFLKNMSGATS